MSEEYKGPTRQAQKTFGDTCELPDDFPSHEEIVRAVQQNAAKIRARVQNLNGKVIYKDNG